MANCDDNCPDAFNPAQTDADSDGQGDACDCEADPQEIGDTLRLDKGPIGDCDSDPATPEIACTELSWDAAVGADRYNVYRGYLNVGTPFAYNQQCLDPNVTTTHAAEPIEPNRFSAFFYLVSSKCPVSNVESGLGRASTGLPRPEAFVCPDPTRDLDGDGVEEALDNCPGFSNPSQADADADSDGDVCDNCPADLNPGQQDLDGDGLGDVCNPDQDGDGIPEDDGDGSADPCTAGNTIDCDDNCPLVANTDQADQADQDGDGIGDACEP